MRWIKFNKSPIALKAAKIDGRSTQAVMVSTDNATNLPGTEIGDKLGLLGFAFRPVQRVWTAPLSEVSTSKLQEVFEDAEVVDYSIQQVMINTSSAKVVEQVSPERKPSRRLIEDINSHKGDSPQLKGIVAAGKTRLKGESDGKQQSDLEHRANDRNRRDIRRESSSGGVDAGIGARPSREKDSGGRREPSGLPGGDSAGLREGVQPSTPEVAGVKREASDERLQGDRELGESVGVRGEESGSRSNSKRRRASVEEKVVNPTDLQQDSVKSVSPPLEGLFSWSVAEAEGNTETGKKNRFQRNLEAIRCLGVIRQNRRAADGTEANTLLKYTGWGGLLDELIEGKDEVLTVLNEHQYKLAKESALSAYHTPPSIVEAQWNKLVEAGFAGGEVLEPSAGTGAYLRHRPTDIDSSASYTAVELDPIAGGILKALNPGADVNICGLENTPFDSESFDLVLGNIPFGEFKVSDKTLGRSLSIHNYFLLKSLEQVREGGVVSIITSTATLDAKSSAFRREIYRQADLVGVLRLPKGAFTGGDTGTSSDLLYFRKRLPGEAPSGIPFVDLEPAMLQPAREFTVTDKNGQEQAYESNLRYKFNINPALANPAALAGEYKLNMDRFGKVVAEVTAEDPIVTAVDAIKSIEVTGDWFEGEKARKGYRQNSTQDTEDSYTEEANRPAVIGSYHIKNGQIVVVHSCEKDHETGKLMTVYLPSELKRGKDRIAPYIKVRDAVLDLLRAETQDLNPNEIESKRVALNLAYDEFTENFGPLNKKFNASVVRKDPQSSMVLALESYDKKLEEAQKTNIFSERVNKPAKRITEAKTFTEAVGVSLSEFGKVSPVRVEELLGQDFDKLVKENPGVVLRNPFTGEYEYRAVALTGNVIQKLEKSEENAKYDPTYNIELEEYTKVVPAPIPYSEITVDFSSTWVPDKYFQAFIQESLKEEGISNHVEFERDRLTKLLTIELDGHVQSDLLESVMRNKLGTTSRGFFELIRSAATNAVINVTKTIDEGGSKKTIQLKEETLKAYTKRDQIVEKFKKWIWRDENRCSELQEIYNKLVNCFHAEPFDANWMTFPGMNPTWEPREHQSALVARKILLGNTLAAHSVGAGKTMEMVMVAMKEKQLGISQKPAIAVPNHMLVHIAVEAQSIYPGAKICMVSRADLADKPRFLGKVAFNDWDIVIMTHSVLNGLRAPEHIEDEVTSFELDKLKSDARKLGTLGKSNRQVEMKIRALEHKITERQLKAKEAKGVVYINETGIDSLNVDEAHLYKNLALDSAAQIPGLSASSSTRAWSLMLLIRYMEELNGPGRGVGFFTGTPIANSITEAYTMGRFLHPKLHEEAGIYDFGDWVGLFGKVTAELEMKPEGGGFHLKARLNQFSNVPELLTIFRMYTDVKTREDLSLPVPDYSESNIAALPDEWGKLYMMDLVDRATAVRNREVEPYQDNLLKIATNGRQASLSNKLLHSQLPDNDQGKIALCSEKIVELHEKYSQQKGAQIVFCDTATPGPGKIYDSYSELKTRLLAAGVPEAEIAFIHDAKTDKQRNELFEKVNAGDVRILIGSTERMGTGTNVQKRLVALHNIDCPWRPADLEQRLGRIVRQGNMFESVQIFNYVMKGSFDLFMWDTVKRKAKFIAQIMRNPKNADRTLVETTDMKYGEVVAAATDNPVIKEFVQVESDVEKLKRQESMHYAANSESKRIYEKAKERISVAKTAIQRVGKDVESIRSAAEKLRGATVDNYITVLGAVKDFQDGPASWLDRKDGAKALFAYTVDTLQFLPVGEEREVGNIAGLPVRITHDHSLLKSSKSGSKDLNQEYLMGRHSELRVPFSDTPHANWTRLSDTAWAGFIRRLEWLNSDVSAYQTTIDNYREGGDFPHQAELTRLIEKKRGLDVQMIEIDEQQQAERQAAGGMGFYNHVAKWCEENDLQFGEQWSDRVGRLVEEIDLSGDSGLQAANSNNVAANAKAIDEIMSSLDENPQPSSSMSP